MIAQQRLGNWKMIDQAAYKKVRNQDGNKKKQEENKIYFSVRYIPHATASLTSADKLGAIFRRLATIIALASMGQTKFAPIQCTGSQSGCILAYC